MRALIGVAALAAGCAALEVLPERSRNGLLGEYVPEWKSFGRHAKSDTASLHIYQAPANHSRPGSLTIPVRYWLDTSCHKSDGPVFVHMGGEGEAGPSSCDSRARKFGAAVLSVEHRFYGKSVPEVAKPLANEYIKYLTVEQNAADTVEILRLVKKDLGATGAIAFGGSYSGGTCAWLRQSYPHDVDGCIGLSGVVNTILDFVQFDTRTYKALASPDSMCPVRMQRATEALERAFAAGKGDAVKKQYNAANLVGTKLGDADFFYGVIDAVVQLNQYGQKKVLCSGLAAIPDSADDETRIAGLYSIIKRNYGPDFVGGCFYDSDCLINEMTCDTGVGNRQWRWQKCHEVAYLQAAPEQQWMRSRKYLTLPALLEQCAYVFNMTTDEVVAGNRKFTESHWNPIVEGKISNVFMINYSDDPWQEASAGTLGSGFQGCMVTCDGCGHCGSGAGSYANKCNAEADTWIARYLS